MSLPYTRRSPRAISSARKQVPVQRSTASSSPGSLSTGRPCRTQHLSNLSTQDWQQDSRSTRTSAQKKYREMLRNRPNTGPSITPSTTGVAVQSTTSSTKLPTYEARVSKDTFKLKHYVGTGILRVETENKIK